MTIPRAAIDVPVEAQVYLCGPPPFMESVRASLIGRDHPADRIHYEIFGPDTWRAVS
ncbi:hypothetical protein [Actinopolymorpha alba]|uniref:hypothetical protein n=1 Tax=Actinopolymorpha alba TaxID=533267 RepID=UPI0003779049|nr:hypothetical protein [Actinopolymorpha alba]